MPRFSLIVATIKRVRELAGLLDSLAAQEGPDFELIVVDQNDDDRLEPTLQSWAAQMTELHAWFTPSEHLIHLRSAPGLSRARNVGLLRSKGEILAFPDDDCWYPFGLLEWVSSWFAGNATYGFLCVGSRNQTGGISGNRLRTDRCDLDPLNIFRGSVSYSIFLDRTTDQPVAFDESLGVGSSTPFGSGEDTDLLLGLMERGVRGRFDRERFVGHPSKGHLNPSRGLQYGLGWGRVLWKHSLPVYAVGFIAFDAVRATGNLLRGDLQMAQAIWAHARGISLGYAAPRLLNPDLRM
jgi:glycosyltransferase involved in cell wall biosynthesis